jgi:hypothetical protein
MREGPRRLDKLFETIGPGQRNVWGYTQGLACRLAAATMPRLSRRLRSIYAKACYAGFFLHSLIIINSEGFIVSLKHDNKFVFDLAGTLLDTIKEITGL